MNQNETGHYSEVARAVASVEMLCGDSWKVVDIYTDYVPDDELRDRCRRHAERNPGVDCRFRRGVIHFNDEFEIVEGE